jgi:hypothetical protein
MNLELRSTVGFGRNLFEVGFSRGHSKVLIPIFYENIPSLIIIEYFFISTIKIINLIFNSFCPTFFMGEQVHNTSMGIKNISSYRKTKIRNNLAKKDKFYCLR